MGARLRNQHAGMFRETVGGFRALGKVGDIALVGGQKNGEGSQRGFRRLFGIDRAKQLAVRDDQLRRVRQRSKRSFQIVAGAAENQAFFVEQHADHLHLRQNQTALWGLNVLRHDKEHQIARRAQIAGDALLFKVGGHGPDDGRAQTLHALPRFRTHGDRRELALLQHAGGQRGRILLVGLVYDGNHRRFARPELLQPCQLLREIIPGKEQESHICFFRCFLRALHAQPAEHSFIIKARRVNEHARPDPVYLHRLVDGIRRGARHVGDKRRLLAGQRVRQRRFSAVSFSENADVQPVGSRRFCQGHVNSSLRGGEFRFLRKAAKRALPFWNSRKLLKKFDQNFQAAVPTADLNRGPGAGSDRPAPRRVLIRFPLPRGPCRPQVRALLTAGPGLADHKFGL